MSYLPISENALLCELFLNLLYPRFDLETLRKSPILEDPVQQIRKRPRLLRGDLVAKICLRDSIEAPSGVFMRV